MLEGKPGTTVSMTVVRPFKPDPDKITLTRSILATPALGEQLYENATILYLKPGVLTAARVDDIAARIKGAGKGHKILLDLRDTTGRRSQAGIAPGQLLHQAGNPRLLEGQKFPVQTFTADPAQCLTDAPVVVLVNRGTYGAPELAAAAIEGLKRGDVVGNAPSAKVGAKNHRSARRWSLCSPSPNMKTPMARNRGRSRHAHAGRLRSRGR